MALKVIPSGHSSTSMWCLPTSVQKEWCVGFHYRNDKESHTFQWRKLLILQHDVDTDVSLSVKFFLKNQHTVLLY